MKKKYKIEEGNIEIEYKRDLNGIDIYLNGNLIHHFSYIYEARKGVKLLHKDKEIQVRLIMGPQILDNPIFCDFYVKFNKKVINNFGDIENNFRKTISIGYMALALITFCIMSFRILIGESSLFHAINIHLAIIIIFYLVGAFAIRITNRFLTILSAIVSIMLLAYFIVCTLIKDLNISFMVIYFFGTIYIMLGMKYILSEIRNISD